MTARTRKCWLLSAFLFSSSLPFNQGRAFTGAGFWSHGHTLFDPKERTLSPPSALLVLNPPFLDPKQEGSFARHTLKSRLPAVCERLVKEGAFKGECISRLRTLAAEIPSQPLARPQEIQGLCSKEDADCFNGEWASWLDERITDPNEKEPWAAALPLISTEMYLYRRVLDATGFFQDGGVDPYASQKDEALASALKSEAFLKAVKLAVGSEGHLPDGLTRALILADLWGNQGDLALAPLDHTNTGAAERISGNSEERLLVDATAGALELLESSAAAQVDFICDNSGVEILCDFVLAFHLIRSGLAKKVVLHVKGEPLFISDAMPKDVESHLVALEGHSDESVRSLGASLRAQMADGTLAVESHMFWTAPRLFWEMPESLSRKLAESSLCIVKGDANFRRLVGDRVWPPTTPLSDVVQPWFPAPMLALRTLKAEIAVGMPEGMAEKLSKEHEGWLTTGEFATVQFVPLQEDS